MLELNEAGNVGVETVGALDDPIYLARNRETHMSMRLILRVVELLENLTSIGTRGLMVTAAEGWRR